MIKLAISRIKEHGQQADSLDRLDVIKSQFRQLEFFITSCKLFKNKIALNLPSRIVGVLNRHKQEEANLKDEAEAILKSIYRVQETGKRFLKS